MWDEQLKSSVFGKVCLSYTFHLTVAIHVTSKHQKGVLLVDEKIAGKFYFVVRIPHDAAQIEQHP